MQPSLAFKLFARKNVAFYTKQDFLSHIETTLMVLPNRKSFDFDCLKSRRIRWYTYIQNISVESGFWRREPMLVTYATEISLLRSLVTSQQFFIHSIEEPWLFFPALFPAFAVKNQQENLATLTIWSRNVTTSTRERTTSARTSADIWRQDGTICSKKKNCPIS